MSDTDYIVRLSDANGILCTRSLSCGPSTFEKAVKQWENKGFIVEVLSYPKGLN